MSFYEAFNYRRVSGFRENQLYTSARQVHAEWREHKKVAILENEIGEFSVDDKILKGAGYKAQTMFSGCICCTISGSLPININAIEEDIHPDWIIIESTGVAYPDSIKLNIKESLNYDSRICCIADAKRWHRLLKPMEVLLSSQLSDADVILINKADAVEEKELESIVESVCGYSHLAAVIPISADQGIDTAVFDIVTGEEE